MSRRFLAEPIILLAVLVEGLHVKLKPRLTNEQLTQMSKAFSIPALRNKVAPPFEIHEINGESFKLAGQVLDFRLGSAEH
ncbi:MAG: hypothetical protein ACRD3T_14460 [Terriglobia bacterium]